MVGVSTLCVGGSRGEGLGEGGCLPFVSMTAEGVGGCLPFVSMIAERVGGCLPFVSMIAEGGWGLSTLCVNDSGGGVGGGVLPFVSIIAGWWWWGVSTLRVDGRGGGGLPFVLMIAEGVGGCLPFVSMP